MQQDEEDMVNKVEGLLLEKTIEKQKKEKIEKSESLNKKEFILTKELNKQLEELALFECCGNRCLRQTWKNSTDFSPALELLIRIRRQIYPKSFYEKKDFLRKALIGYYNYYSYYNNNIDNNQKQIIILYENSM